MYIAKIQYIGLALNIWWLIPPTWQTESVIDVLLIFPETLRSVMTAMIIQSFHWE